MIIQTELPQVVIENVARWLNSSQITVHNEQYSTSEMFSPVSIPTAKKKASWYSTVIFASFLVWFPTFLHFSTRLGIQKPTKIMSIHMFLHSSTLQSQPDILFGRIYTLHHYIIIFPIEAMIAHKCSWVIPVQVDQTKPIMQQPCLWLDMVIRSPFIIVIEIYTPLCLPKWMI